MEIIILGLFVMFILKKTFIRDKKKNNINIAIRKLKDMGYKVEFDMDKHSKTIRRKINKSIIDEKLSAPIHRVVDGVAITMPTHLDIINNC